MAASKKPAPKPTASKKPTPAKPAPTKTAAPKAAAPKVPPPAAPKAAAPKAAAPKAAVPKAAAPKAPYTAPKVTSTQAPPKAATPSTIDAGTINALKAVSNRVDFRALVLEDGGPRTVDKQTSIDQGLWFAAVPITPSPRRYQFLMQWEGESHNFVLYSIVDGAGATRLPAGTGWQRALVEGPLHVLASDEPLTRAEIAGIIGGHEPAPGFAKPPNT